MEIRAGTEDPLTLGELRRQRSEKSDMDLQLWERGLARHQGRAAAAEAQPELYPLTEEEVTRAEDRAALLELERELRVYRFDVAHRTERLGDGGGGSGGGGGGSGGGGSGGAMGLACRHACNHACRPVSAPPARAARAADLVRRRQAAVGTFEKEHRRRGLEGVKAALALHDEGERGRGASTFDRAVDSIRRNRPQVLTPTLTLTLALDLTLTLILTLTPTLTLTRSGTSPTWRPKRRSAATPLNRVGGQRRRRRPRSRRGNSRPRSGHHASSTAVCHTGLEPQTTRVAGRVPGRSCSATHTCGPHPEQMPHGSTTRQL